MRGDARSRQLLAILDQAYDKRSWHGANLRGSIRGVSATQASRRPRPRRHNIWEIVVHAAYWKYVVWRKLTDEPRGSFPLKGSNWFTRPQDASERAWRADVTLLADMHRLLRKAVAKSRSHRHDFLISGAAAHDLYHAGQIQLLKKLFAIGLVAVCLMAPARAAGPSYVDMTWMSISNIYYQIGPLRILTDGYITRLPQAAFSGGGGGLATTNRSFTPDVDAVRRVMAALGGRSSVNLLLTGHSHFDHAFDTATWSRLTGARIIGSKTTCFQAMAEDIPEKRCTAVYGGERMSLGQGVTLRVVRWNHSGDPAVNPEQHNPVELDATPRRDPKTGGLRAGVAEDFPNGGGNRAYLFVVDSPDGRFSWFFQNSASPVDLRAPIVVGGASYGAPLDNLKAALAAEKLDSVDLWIGTGGLPIAQLVLPVLKPKAYLPVHWDGLWGAFNAGVPQPYSDPTLERFLEDSHVRLIKPGQYMDKWRLDRNGVRAIDNSAVKQALGFN